MSDSVTSQPRYGRTRPIAVSVDLDNIEVILESTGQTIILDYAQVGEIAQQLCYLMLSLPIPGGNKVTKN